MASVSNDDPWAAHWLRPSLGLDGSSFDPFDHEAEQRGHADGPGAAAHALYDQVQVVTRALNDDQRWYDWWTSSSGVAALQMPMIVRGPEHPVDGIHLEATQGRRVHRIEVTVNGPDVDAEDHTALRDIALTHVLAALTHAAATFRLEPLPALPTLPRPAAVTENPYAAPPPDFAGDAKVPDLPAPDGCPTLIAIDPDDHHAEHVGRLADGRQFFLTTPFEPGGEEFLALYLFDSEGALLEAMIDAFGPRPDMDTKARKRLQKERLKSLGKTRTTRIEVAPFSVERFGRTFGLIAKEPEVEGDPWAVEVEPGNYMAFFPPWDSGVYDT